jgi:hypothetical protein
MNIEEKVKFDLVFTLTARRNYGRNAFTTKNYLSIGVFVVKVFMLRHEVGWTRTYS